MSAAPNRRINASSSAEFGFVGGETPSTSTGGFRTLVSDDRIPPDIETLVLDLFDPDRRDRALVKLAGQVQFPNLARLIWFSSGTVAILLQEIVAVYPMLSPPKLTKDQSTRVCHALALLQCVAAHPDTRSVFIKAYIPYYLTSFLINPSQTEQSEFLRLGSLGVIGALVKVQDTNVIIFLLSSEMMPVCLHCMEKGSTLSKTVATFILHKILLDDVGLEYVCTTPERLFAVNQALANVVTAVIEQPLANRQSLLKHVIKCYVRLSEDERSHWTLRSFFPRSLVDGTFHHYLSEDLAARAWLKQFVENISEPPIA